MSLSKDQKQKLAVAVLLPVAAYTAYTNILGGGGGDESAAPVAPAAVRMPQKLQTLETAAAAKGPSAANVAASRSRRAGLNTAQEWTPRVGSRRPEERADPARTEIALRQDLLAKLSRLPVSQPGRSLFDFSNAPAAAPKQPDIKVLTKKGRGGKGVDTAKPVDVAPAPPPEPTGPPPEPQAPPVPLKFYGYVQGQGGKRAFFRLGADEIFMAREGQLIQGRYKIARIGLSSAAVEDTQFKVNNQQSLRIEEIPKENF
ncbi:MAG: hypothetical protein FJW31_05140 [Acidobacteria bacterium]|nr:hypothetical protein [Acidobacteriota bacterium]